MQRKKEKNPEVFEVNGLLILFMSYLGFGPSDITICVLGCPASYLSVLLEGGNQCPGKFLD